MGVVYVGVDVRLGRRAAIKQLLPAMSGDRAIVERFFNEAKAAASINHPGIVEIYDVGWHSDGSAYFAMKLLEGDSLSKRLRERGPMPVQLCATIARQIASALGAAHARGIVHRDLKPDNIVLVADDEVAIGERATVLDFGIAKLFGDNPMTSKTRTGSVMGTPYYMSPEQCRGAGEIDHRTDVYALGCLVFEMLTGRPPFVAEGAGEILGMHQFVEPPALRGVRADVPPDLEATVMRMLAKRAEHRPQSMTEVTAALQAFATQGARAMEPARVSGGGAAAMPYPSQPGAQAASYPGQPGAPVAPIPSTLGGSAGQLGTAPTAGASGMPPRRKPWLAIGGGAVVAIGVAIAVAVSAGGGAKSTTTAAATTADAGPGGEPAAAVDAAAVAAPTADAATEVAVIDAAAAPDADAALLAALKAEVEREDFSRAFTIWDGIAEKSAAHAAGRDVLAAEASAAFDSGKWGRALVIAERILDDYPRETTMINVAGVAACELKNATKARVHYARLSGAARDEMRKECRDAGVTNLESKPAGEASIGDAPGDRSPPDVATPAREGDTRRADGLNEEGKALLMAKRYSEGSAKFRAAIALSPEGRFYLNLCMALYQEGKLGEAKRACGEVAAHGATAHQVGQAKKILTDFIEPKLQAPSPY